MNPSFAQASPQALVAGDPDQGAVLDAALAPLRAEFGTVDLVVERMDRLGNWAFVIGDMRSPGGGRLDMSGTRFADAAEQGAMSSVYVALLRREGDAAGDASDAATESTAAGAGPAAPAEAAARDQAGLQQEDADPAVAAETPRGRWVVVDFAIGPGDVAWLGWPQEHAAPRALFGF
ncbi:hypothetical protein H9645_07475 [Luteimonas sp. Sa2BVA3]|uniref:Uncharacterized protein n=1 Tax=Luteimonas colneyensis TaxID=2762230 RepID=A0ABR8UIM3_9GAMM|nr:hypothetical protein [Luteimonas colneyensis]MBD7987867.1 hypothetical protein [Luteimonas colneyensis]